MALSRRATRNVSSSIWPGFVDAMTALLLVLMFVLTIFMVVQFVLRETISGQASELDALSAQVAELADALGMEQSRAARLEGEVGTLTASLGQARTEAQAQAALIASLNAKSPGRKMSWRRGRRGSPPSSSRSPRFWPNAIRRFSAAIRWRPGSTNWKPPRRG